MHILYPSDPLNVRVVDETYGAEYQAARTAGYSTSLFSVEDFEAGTFRARPALPAGETIVYRGWMLTLPLYARLVTEIEAALGVPLTSMAHYQLCHHLPGWYPLVRDFTAETTVLEVDTDYAAGVNQDWPGYFVKDYVKSLSTGGGSLVSRPADIAAVVASIKKYRGFIEGGVCVRRKESFRLDSERRFFVFGGRPMSQEGDIPDLVVSLAQRIESRFYSIDTAVREDGQVRLVEVGDGQVSDRKEWTPERFIEGLRFAA